MPPVSLNLLDPHPENANITPADVMAKLAAHIRASGRYPPLIVRLHPQHAGRYQILDGHHRALVLRELGFESAQCEVWPIEDDNAARLLLLTLNRLQGQDDPQKRGALLEKLRQSVDVKKLARLLPEDLKRIDALIKASQSPPALQPPLALAEIPQAITFFLTQPQYECLLMRLEPLGRDRSQALIALLKLNQAW